ncbi:TPA: hypothetical protein JG832_002432 [Enterobacter hormaechei subsp. xiangfangensis]|nr:hypothetical protein [Enterobacter hormaechei subsp. xiangfangensis]HAV1890568.1 hypothetical protein [Enterobacter hormaechei subsp. xiangfangensis]
MAIKAKGVITAVGTREQKIRYVWQAKREKLTLEEWLLKHLDAVCDAAGTPHPEKPE